MDDKRELVTEIFEDYFGEENVELQESHILVHFPKVTVSNEYGESTDITHLFVKVPVNEQGRMTGDFTMTRSEYTDREVESDYSHSHLSGIKVEFAKPCTGTGPINNTTRSLSREFNEDLWRMFTVELDLFVKTESIEGIPYRRLSEICSSRDCVLDTLHSGSRFRNFFTQDIREALDMMPLEDFLRYILDSNLLKYNFIEQYGIAMSDFETFALINNLFIKWYNEEFFPKHPEVTQTVLLKHSILIKRIIRNKALYYIYRANRSLSSYDSDNPPLITEFKGKQWFLNVIDTREQKYKFNIVLNNKIVFYIVDNLLYQINFLYGRKESYIQNSKSTNRTYISRNCTVF